MWPAPPRSAREVVSELRKSALRSVAGFSVDWFSSLKRNMKNCIYIVRYSYGGISLKESHAMTIKEVVSTGHTLSEYIAKENDTKSH